MEDNRFYVYVHRVKEDFELNGISYKEGSVVYVGSGCNKRHLSKQGRSPQHLELWDFLTKVIVTHSLIEIDSRIREQALIVECLSDGCFLLNKNLNCGTTKRKEIQFDKMNNNFYIDPSSPSFLRWKVDIKGGFGALFKKKDTVAGTSKNNAGYRLVQVSGMSYFVHKIIWVLHNKKDCPADFVVDHIDGDVNNCNPLNLKISTSRDNNCNKKISCRNKSGFPGVYLKDMKGDMFWTATWQDAEGKKNRKHFGVNKYGNDRAFELACQHRELMIKSLIEQGVMYTERHIYG